MAGLSIGLVMFSTVMAILVGTGAYRVSYLRVAPAWHGIGLAIESGVLEEVLIRGVVMRLVWRAFGPVAGLVVSALLFGVGHVGNPGAVMLIGLVIGCTAGWLLECEGGTRRLSDGKIWLRGE
jgi:membrane protease YdiL (CAAX protease family)